MKFLKIILPIIVLAFGIWCFNYFMTHKVKTPKKTIKYKGPIVEVIKVTKKDQYIEIEENGFVRPYRKVNIIPEVSGKIVYISPNFYEGKFIKKGEILIKLEKIDYEAAYFNALKNLKNAILNYEKIKEQANISRKEWEAATKEYKLKKPSPLKLYIPQLKSAKATLKAAKKNVELAKQNLKRTVIKAPFNAFVSKKLCDLGEFIVTGKPVGTLIYSDKAEVVIPIPDYEYQWLDFNHKDVKIIVKLKNKIYNHKAKLSRISKVSDINTRTINLILEVSNPFKKKNKPPLFINMFVSAKFKGKLIKNIAKIPDYAIHNKNEIWIYKNGKLYIQKTMILKRNKNFVYISKNINNGDYLITTHLPYVSNGMKVRVLK